MHSGAHTLKDKTVVITGATRGIGLAIAMRAAAEGARIVLLGKTVRKHPHLPGTLYTAAEQVEKTGAAALAIPTDIRDESQVREAIERTIETFGAIDILVNNASAISLTNTRDTSMKRFDLMHQVNARGTFLCSKYCQPHLQKSTNPHVLVLAPPLNLKPEWFAPHMAYSLSKYGMSLCVLGMSAEFRRQAIAVNALWPATVIDTAALRILPEGADLAARSRKPEIVADAACAVLVRDSRTCSGNFYIDEQVLRENGMKNFDHYLVTPGAEPYPDIFL